MKTELLRAYKEFRRAETFGAKWALECARHRDAAGAKYFSNDWPWNRGQWNVTPIEHRKGKDGAWIENTKSAGLRFVAYADELTNIRHKGWFTNPNFFDEVLRGAVWQLPARNGAARFVAGYVDPNNEGAAFVDLNDIHEARGDNTEDAKRGAAYAADSLAERVAEREREYNEQWQAGARWADLGERLAELRRETLAFIAELKTLARPEICGKPHLLQATRDCVRFKLDKLSECKRERAKLFRDFGETPGFAEHL